MYTSFYKLSELPFNISTDTRFLWRGEKHEEALANLKYGLLEANGYVVLTGDVGTGKTTLVNALIENLDDNVIVANINHPTLETVEFFHLVAKTYDPSAEIKSKTEFLFFFKSFLQKSHAAGKVVLLVIDEAHCLSKELLEEIRLLSNMEHAGMKLINIFFVGQNEFKESMLCKQFRALRQRITLFYDIEPFSESETLKYVSHRLKVAGAKKQLFTREAIREIQNFTCGYPRLINILCGRCLLTGYVKDSRVIDKAIVMECVNEIRFLDPNASAVPEKNIDMHSDRYPTLTVNELPEPMVSLKNEHPHREETREDVAIKPEVLQGNFGKTHRKKNRLPVMPIVLLGFLGLGLYGAALTMNIDLKSEAAAILDRLDKFDWMNDVQESRKTARPDISLIAEQQRGEVHQLAIGQLPEVPEKLLTPEPDQSKEIEEEVAAPKNLTVTAEEPVREETGPAKFSPPEEQSPAASQSAEIKAVEPSQLPQSTTLELASAALQRNNFQTAIDLLEADKNSAGAADSKKTYAKALVGRAEQLMAASPVEAEILFHKAVEVDPENIKAHFNLGKIYTRSKEYALAIDAYRNAGTLDPGMSDAFFNLGFIYATTGMYEDAEKLFLRVVGLEPDYLDKALFNLAVIQEKLGKDKECLDNLQMAVRINPENQKVRDYLKRFSGPAEEIVR